MFLFIYLFIHLFIYLFIYLFLLTSTGTLNMNSHSLFRSRIDKKRLNIPNLEIRTYTRTKKYIWGRTRRVKNFKEEYFNCFWLYPSRSASVYSIIKLVKDYVAKENFIFYFQPLIKGLFNYLHAFYMRAINKEYIPFRITFNCV